MVKITEQNGTEYALGAFIFYLLFDLVRVVCLSINQFFYLSYIRKHANSYGDKCTFPKELTQHLNTS